MKASPQTPTPLWRAMTLLGLWIILFGAATAIVPLHLEAGLNVTQEKLKAVLLAPVLGALGLAALFEGPRPSAFSGIFAFGILLFLSAWMLIYCRTRRAFWMLTACHFVVILAASIGFGQMTRYWSENP